MAVLDEALGGGTIRPSILEAIRARHEGRRLSRLIAVALLLFAQGLVHLGQAPGHFDEYAPFGVLFLLAGTAQIGCAWATLARPQGRLFLGAAVGTVGLIATWFWSRLSGLPVGPHAGYPEVPGMLDMVTTLSEIVTVVLLLFLVRAPRKPKRRGPVRVTLAALPSLIFVIPLLVFGLQAPFHPMPDAFDPAGVQAGQAATSITTLQAPAGSQPVRAFTLTAAPVNVAGHQGWAFNGSVPGPEIRVTEGDRVKVTLLNHLPESTSIHWHGLRLPNPSDGVAGVTQDAVRPGQSYVYEFIAQDPGTYWYHTHQATLSQLGRGLYGAITILPKAGIKEQHDYSVVIHTAVGSSDARINGSANARLEARPGETVRLRLVNAAVPDPFGGTPLNPVLLGVPYRVVALDGHDVNRPQEIGPQKIRLGMGQRADLVFTMPPSGQVVLTGLKGAAQSPFDFSSTGPASLTLGEGPAPEKPARLQNFDITTYGEPAAEALTAATHYDVTRTLQLAGVPIFRNGTFDFSDTFDGKASPFVPPVTVHEGDLVKLRLVNRSQKFHPIHIHGHVFTVLSRNGVPLSGSPIHQDAVLLPAGETWEVAFKADNPGIWMLHCHVLGHAWAGMVMTVNYDGYTTPFRMGTSSGNEPE